MVKPAEQIQPIAPAEIKVAELVTKMPVKLAMLQAAVRLPGGRTEVDLNPVKITGLEMLWIRGEGLLVKYKNEEGLIPCTNIKMVHFK